MRRIPTLLWALAGLVACDDARVARGGQAADARPSDAIADAAPGDNGKLLPDVDVLGPDTGAASFDATPRFDAASAEPDAAPPDASEPPDSGLPPGPTPAACLEGWRQLPPGSCAAPIIDRSYVTDGCVGTTGWFVEGANFQLEQRNVGIADYGPQSIGVNSSQRHWNVIRPDLLCVTISANGRGTWVGAEIYVINPDGQRSNAVTVQDYWPGPPPPRATDGGVGVDR